MKSKPEVWTSRGLLAHIRNLHGNRPNQRLVFILGAGASVTSGIPAGGSLVERWLGELHERLCHGESSLVEWATEQNLEIPGFEYSRRAEFYPQVFERRYRHDPGEGYETLEAIMDRAQPSFGYSVLAQILASERHNVVVTTNFDNLVADALATYSGRHPLMVGHESLTGYARARLGRPLVAKIHRDLFLDPINDHAGTNELATGWKTALTELFKHHTPIVIGYGGNDGSLMGFLETLPDNHIPGRMFWTYRESSGCPEGRIAEVVARHKGVLVPIIGFDEFMLQIREIFELDDLTEHIGKQAEEHLKRYREQTERLLKAVNETSHGPSRDSGEQTSVHQAATAFAAQQHSWLAWALKAAVESDPEKQENIFRAGLRQFPDSPELIGHFANFMRAVRRDYDEAERLYRRALELDPNDASHTGNFAGFLEGIRKDYDEAERLYRRALELDPNNASHTGNFAGLLANIRKDYGEAERLYRRSLELDPDNAIHTGNFANFMADIRKDYDEAERLYRRTLELAPNHASHTGNFASFVRTVRKDHDEAERLYRRAMELDPENANNTGNFAGFLANIRNDYDEAERLYRRTLELDPDNANHTGNFANFMADIRKDYDEAERLYRRALELDPDNANHTGNFANFMRNVRKDHDEAERLYRCALQIDPDHANNTGNFALFMAAMRKDYDEAERLYRHALQIDPNNTKYSSNFAELLLLRNETDAAISQAKSAWQLAGAGEYSLLAPIAFILSLAGEQQRVDTTPALARLKALIKAGNTRSSWSFEALLAWAEQTLGMAAADFYRALAAAIQDETKVADLEAFPHWRDIEPVTPDNLTGWPAG